MANLIITIISIALVAITALLGIYYGGAAYNNYQYKVKAQQILDGMQQIANGWTLYAADHDGSRALTNWQAGVPPFFLPRTSTDLIPKYLSEFPAVPTEFETNGNGGFDTFMYLYEVDATHHNLIGYGTTGSNATVAIAATSQDSVNGPEICKAFNKIVKNDPTVNNFNNSNTLDGSTLDQLLEGQKANCIYGIYNATYFLYRF